MRAHQKPNELQRLTKEESEELSKALDDGFAVYGTMHGRRVSLDGFIDEPFFHACVSGSGKGSGDTFADFVAELRPQGLTDDEIKEDYELYLEDMTSEDAPSWRDTNPFCFNIRKIRSLFEAKFSELHPSLETSDDECRGELDPFEFLRFHELYSKQWFELTIVCEFRMLDITFEENIGEGPLSGLHQIFLLSTAAQIGRLIEHYRWRFSYGVDALRGASTLNAARRGGLAKRGITGEDSINIVHEMRRLIDDGRKVSDAASAIFRRGIGRSASANRALWYRKAKKL